MSNIETIADLRDYLQDIIDRLDGDWDEDQKVYVSPNTYRMYPPFLAVRDGFIDLDNPVWEED